MQKLMSFLLRIHIHQMFSLLSLVRGSEDGSAVERRTRDPKVAVRVPTGAAGEFSSPGSTFCADSYFGICSTPLVPQ